MIAVFCRAFSVFGQRNIHCIINYAEKQVAKFILQVYMNHCRRNGDMVYYASLLPPMSLSCVNAMDFNCRQCGACCRIPNGIVRVTNAEIARIADHLGMNENDFIANETELAPDRRGLVLKSLPGGACAWLTSDNRCRIHAVKPDKCRTFPYDWTNPDSTEVCPGLAAMKMVEVGGVEPPSETASTKLLRV